jgi:flavodoxin
MSNILIACFSRAGENYVGGSIRRLEVGNTEVAAEMIAELTGGELFKIDPVEPYSDKYMTCIEEAKRDLQAGVRPALKEIPESISRYDTVYLCYPNYWGTMPMAVFTFLEQFDFTGKTIHPLCTNEGSGLGNSEADIRRLCPGAVLKPGLAVTGGQVGGAREKIKNWIHA